MNAFRSLVLSVILLSICTRRSYSQQICLFEAFAGPPLSNVGDGGPATSGYLFAPHAISVDSSGNLYIADTWNHRIRRVNADGSIITVAGNGKPGSDGDGGSALEAFLSAPEAVVPGPDGALYIADTGNHKIRVVRSDGRIATLAGTGHPGFHGDGGRASEAELRGPAGVVLDSHGVLYVADTGNDRIRRIDREGVITTVAGTRNPESITPGCCSGGDRGPATRARLQRPRGLAVGPDGVIYIADTGNNLVRRVASDGTITTIAGTPNANYTSPSYPAPAATPLGFGPGNVALLPDGSLLIPDHRLLRLTPDGTTLELYGGGVGNYVAVDGQGNVYLSGYATRDRVTRARPAAAAPETYAGRERFGFGSGTTAIGPAVDSPAALAIGPDGAVYVADYNNRRVVRIQNGIIQRVASAQGPVSVAIDVAGNIFIADYVARLVRKTTSDGTTVTIAGGGGASLPLAGGRSVPATSVALRPNGLVAHPNGSIYVATLTGPGSTGPESILRITPDGMLTTIYNSWRPGGFDIVSRYRGLGLDSSGNLLIPTDSRSTEAQILRLTPEGDFLSDIGMAPGQGTSIVSVAGGPSGAVYIADSLGRVKKLSADGIFTTIYNRDLDEYLRSPHELSFDSPESFGSTSLAVDSKGNLFVSQRFCIAFSNFPRTHVHLRSSHELHWFHLHRHP